jgi:GntR family transcriptional regulator/MocR family aminotransferase
VVVTQGFSQALDLICRMLAMRGATTVAVENPSLDHLWDTVKAAGLRLVGVPMDEHGPRLDVLDRVRPDAFVVSPAHQYPSGQVMAADRRTSLIAWTRARDALLVEDDYDAEFRYDRLPIGALQGLDPERVIHAGTASKTLAPGLRLGWLSLPAHVVEPLVAVKHLTDSGSPAIEQLALAHLLERGEYERHVARARSAYRLRRDRLIAALAVHLPDVPPRGIAAGVHVLLPLPDDVDDVRVSAAAEDAGIRVRPVSPTYVPGAERGSTPDRGLLLGYSRLTPTRIDEAVAA